ADHGASHGNPSSSLSSRAYPVVGDRVLDIAHDPPAVPPPISRSTPETVRIDLEASELEARLDQRATCRYWTCNGPVPGPFLRVRVGDTVELYLRNHEDSWMQHNIDLHAATGPGGGAELTTVGPGEERGVRFKALKPGLYV